MSAAEKLEALVKGFWEDTEPSGYEAPVEIIRALPQIVAVVKAMEENEKEASSPTMMSLRHLENIAARSHSALAALDEKLASDR